MQELENGRYITLNGMRVPRHEAGGLAQTLLQSAAQIYKVPEIAAPVIALLCSAAYYASEARVILGYDGLVVPIMIVSAKGVNAIFNEAVFGEGHNRCFDTHPSERARLSPGDESRVRMAMGVSAAAGAFILGPEMLIQGEILADEAASWGRRLVAGTSIFALAINTALPLLRFHKVLSGAWMLTANLPPQGPPPRDRGFEDLVPIPVRSNPGRQRMAPR